MSYLDKTFCCSHNCKNDCGRKLTEEIRQGARASNNFLSLHPFCGKPLDEKDEELQREEMLQAEYLY